MRSRAAHVVPSVAASREHDRAPLPWLLDAGAAVPTQPSWPHSILTPLPPRSLTYGIFNLESLHTMISYCFKKQKKMFIKFIAALRAFPPQGRLRRARFPPRIAPLVGFSRPGHDLASSL